MKVTINGTEKEIPESWDDLSLHQQHTIYHTLYATPSEFLTNDVQLPAKRISIAMFLADINDDFLELWELDCIKTFGARTGPDQFFAELHDFLRITDFLFDITVEEVEATGEEVYYYSVKLGLTKNPYPVLKSKKGKWYGPADDLDNLTIYELGVAFTYFEEYIRSQNIDLAIYLIALLWRPGKPKTKKNKRMDYAGDRRLPYLNHETTVDRRIPMIKALPSGVCQLMLFYFASCRQAIIEANPDIFKAPEGDDGERADYGKLLLEISGGVVNLDKVSKQNYANVFLYLSKLERERQERALRERR